MDVTWPTNQIMLAANAAWRSALAAGEPAGITLTQVVLLALAIVSLTMLMLSTRRRLMKSRQMPRTSIRERYVGLREKNEATCGMEQAMLQLDQLSRQIHGRLDTKLARLEAVIRDADRRIDALSRLAPAAEGSRRLEITLDEERPRDDRVPEGDVRHSAVYRLADQGLATVDIAEHTGRTTGEVELILALRKTISTIPPSGTAAPARARS